MKLIRRVLPYAALASLLVAAACSSASTSAGAGGGAAAAVAVTPAMLEQGRTIYTGAGRCAFCHGQTGTGGRGPNLTDNTWLWIQADQPLHPQLVNIIRVGVPQPREAQIPMPAMGGAQLTPDELNALAAYVETL
jgi:mono/diheme cytochrome c family protein